MVPMTSPTSQGARPTGAPHPADAPPAPQEPTDALPSEGGESGGGGAGREDGRRLKVSCVVLTMAKRTAELRRAVDSVFEQQGVDIELVVVSNGADLPDLPDNVITHRLPENIGIPAGRNKGAELVTGDIILFLDDDGWYRSPDLARHVHDRFVADPRLGAVSFRIADPDGGPDQRRHLPRLGSSDPLRSSKVTTFLGGACAIRTAAFEKAGGQAAEFFYAHEETDLAWRIQDAGYDIVYDAEAVMYHPATLPTRHADFYRLNARNRVWLARRNLPWPLAFAYLGVWTGITVLRERDMGNLKRWFDGFKEGWRKDPGRRSPMKWSTAWRMTKAGRPPII